MSDSANALLHSRKFLLALTDAVASTALLLATRFLSPSDVDLAKMLIVVYQPVIIAVIVSIAAEDAAKHAADAKVEAARIQASTPNLTVTTTGVGGVVPLVNNTGVVP